QLAPDKRIAVTEFGTLFDADSMLAAIIAADFTRVAVEESWLVRMRHILIEDDPSEPFATSAAVLGADHRHTPGWEASRLLAHAVLATRVPTMLTTPAAGDDIVILATRTDDTRQAASGWMKKKIELDDINVSPIPPSERVTIFAAALGVVAMDEQVVDAEKAFLKRLQIALQIDDATAGSIRKSAG